MSEKKVDKKVFEFENSFDKNQFWVRFDKLWSSIPGIINDEERERTRLQCFNLLSELIESLEPVEKIKIKRESEKVIANIRSKALRSISSIIASCGIETLLLLSAAQFDNNYLWASVCLSTVFFGILFVLVVKDCC